MAESMLVGGDAFNDLEDLRADDAGAELRAVADVPAASTAAQLARRLRPSHLRAAEAATAAAGDRLVAELGRDASEPVTLDFDSTLVEVYGRKKPRPLARPTPASSPTSPCWASGPSAGGCSAPSSCLDPTRPGPMTPSRWCAAPWRCCRPATATSAPASMRASTGSSSFRCCAERASRSRSRCRAHRPCGRRSRGSPSATGRRLSISRTPKWPRRATRPRAGSAGPCAFSCAGWPSRPRVWPAIRARAGGADPEGAALPGRLRRGHDRLWLQLLPHRPAGPPRAWSTITAVGPRSTSASRTTNWASRSGIWRPRTWPPIAPGCWPARSRSTCSMLSNVAFGPDPDERLPRRRQAKHLRRMLVCVPARVIHHDRGVILRLPAGLRWADDFARVYSRARGLSPPAGPKHRDHHHAAPTRAQPPRGSARSTPRAIRHPNRDSSGCSALYRLRSAPGRPVTSRQRAYS